MTGTCGTVCVGIRLRISKVAAAANGWCFGEMRTLPHPQSSCLPPPPLRVEPLRRVVAALGYEKSLVIIDACENSLDSHTCPSAPLPPLARNSSGCPCSKSSPFLWHWSAINYATCCVFRLPHEYIDICSCEKSCPKNFDPSPHPPAPCFLSLAN